MQSFIDELLPASMLVVVGYNRYGAGYSAYFANEDNAGQIQCLLTSGDDDYGNLAYGVLGALWYPFATGNTPQDALANLESCCKRLLEVDWGTETPEYYIANINHVLFAPGARDPRPELQANAFQRFCALDALKKPELAELIETLLARRNEECNDAGR